MQGGGGGCPKGTMSPFLPFFLLEGFPKIHLQLHNAHDEGNQDLLVCECVMNVAINLWFAINKETLAIDVSCGRYYIALHSMYPSPRRWCLGPLPAPIFTPQCTDCTLPC